MSTRTLLAAALLLLATAALAQPLDLIAGLNQGVLVAEFRGAGDRAVTGTIGRTGDAPLDVNIAPGTQFWAQAGGRQGQATFGSVPVDLTHTRLAQVTLHTCCTNLGLPDAKPTDLMIPVACPDPRLARLLSLPGIQSQPHMAVQAAVWAVANDATGYRIRQALRREPQVGSSTFAADMVTAAANLLRQAGLEPTAFRAFR
jgi:hypothetical protein